MATRVAPFRCTSCSHESPRWFGRCPGCGDWSTAETAPAPPGGGRGGARRGVHGAAAPALATLAAPAAPSPRVGSGNDEVDRVLGGGFVPGEVVLLAGEPGVGKSTLVLQVLAGVAASGGRVLLTTGEESLAQVSLRAVRLGLDAESITAVAEPSLPGILAACASHRPELLVVDSIQTVEDPAFEQPAGSIVQVRECAATLARHAKATNTIVVLVGHVTKDGSVAGPRTLEHLVDAVVSLEGDRSASLRLLRASKNRFGSCEETGVFTMERDGLVVVPDPSSMLLADRCEGVAGSLVVPGLEGSRPVLVELQALATPSDLPQPRRVALGVDARRLSMLGGVLEKAGVRLGKRDLFTSAAGGLAVREPAADLALCLAIESAVSDVPVDARTVALGEVGLGGEIRRVPGTERRLAEAARLGFRRAIVPAGAEVSGATIEVVRAARLRDAFTAAAAHPARSTAG
ncbi:MAG TPA: DNA repair protein RadA [Actinomycetota bacterium]|nr:DNA repair protein RadA [Actinomycetota bacterium]